MRKKFERTRTVTTAIAGAVLAMSFSVAPASAAPPWLTRARRVPLLSTNLRNHRDPPDQWRREQLWGPGGTLSPWQHPTPPG